MSTHFPADLCFLPAVGKSAKVRVLTVGWRRPRSWASAISRIDFRELAAHFCRLAERDAAGEYARAKPLPEEIPFGRSW